MGNAGKLSYCADLARTHDCDRFLTALFVPAPAREKLHALFALDAELAHVHHAVSEEMTAQIRYAWWQENIEAIAAGKKPREHPVLEALAAASLPYDRLLALVESYRKHYPELPNNDTELEEITLTLLQNDPWAEKGWRKARAIIQNHRARFGAGWNGWLNLKLLLAGTIISSP